MITAAIEDEAESVLEVLCDYFVEHQGQNNAEIKEGFERLYKELIGINLQNTDKIVDIVCDLCQTHQRNAFATGVKVGVKLEKELQ